MVKPKAKVVHYTEIPAQVIGENAPGASIRWLINKENDGAPVFALRLVELQPDGKSLRHTHAYEHENFVVEGKGRVFIEDRWFDLSVGDVAFIPPGVLHQFINAGDSSFKFLCGIPE